MKVSVIIPCYNAYGTLEDTLRSVYEVRDGIPDDVTVEAIVVDDASTDPAALSEIVAKFPLATILHHETNAGTAAARNTGIDQSSGDIVIMLDADDFFMPDWIARLIAIMEDWPEDCMACFNECRTHEGLPTSEAPGYTGRVDIAGFLSEKIFGEYLPIFRGEFIRTHKYIDLKQRRGCEIVTYVKMAKTTPFWVTPQTLRIYRYQHPESGTANWASEDTARELIACYNYLLSEYKDDYQKYAPGSFRRRQLRLAVYKRLARQSSFWLEWLRGAHFQIIIESAASFLLILFGPFFIRHAVPVAKKLGLVRRFG